MSASPANTSRDRTGALQRSQTIRTGRRHWLIAAVIGGAGLALLIPVLLFRLRPLLPTLLLAAAGCGLIIAAPVTVIAYDMQRFGSVCTGILLLAGAFVGVGFSSQLAAAYGYHATYGILGLLGGYCTGMLTTLRWFRRIEPPNITA